ncbi:MAG: hypothetical protein Q7K26_06240 [bacterium]|nr:hypothetical protein [bacterium]
MDLIKFRTLTDAHLETTTQAAQRITEAALFEEIRSYFPPVKSSEALAKVRTIIHELAIRHLCDKQLLQPYRNVAQALKIALRVHGTSAAEVINWESAILAAVRYHLHFPPWRSPEQELVSDVRAQVVSKSINGLRDSGYQILLPEIGGLDMPDPEVARLQEDIDTLARKLGGEALVATAMAEIEPTYSSTTDRFNLGRHGQQVRLDASPQVPFAFLFQLGLKYFHCKQTHDAGQAEFTRLLGLLTFAVGILDLEADDTMGMIFARSRDILETTRKSLLYDATFCLVQAKPNHVETFVRWLLTYQQFSKLVDKDGFNSPHILAAAIVLLKETSCGPTGIQRIPPAALAELGGMDSPSAQRLLTRIFAHDFGKINLKLTFPLQDSEVNAAFRPLLIDEQGSLLRLPPNIAARATLNAVIEWCRRAWPDKKGFDETLGLALEQFVRDQFSAKGVKIHYGIYGNNSERSECDLAIQTESHIIFFELKGKVLTRQSRSGDVLKALEDLADSLARPQAQAMERHAFLKEHKTIELRFNEELSVIELGSKEVLKVSVTRGELLSLHDRPYLWHYLLAGCEMDFETTDPTQQKNLEPLHEWFRKFKDAAKRAGEYDLTNRFPFSRCWSLSLFQILLLLERTASADDFVRELLRTAHISITSRDFYASYEQLLNLQELKKSSD